MFSYLVSMSVVLCTRLAFAAPAATAPSVTIAFPQATIIGKSGSVEIFPGVPFAKPPVGPLRLKPPQRLDSPMGTYLATANGKACPQFFFSTVKNDAIPTSLLGVLLNTPLFQTVLNTGEDCLNINSRYCGRSISTNSRMLLIENDNSPPSGRDETHG